MAAFPGVKAVGSFKRSEHESLPRTGTLLLPPSAPWTQGRGEDDVEAKEFRLEDLTIDEARIYENLCPHRSFKVKEGYEMKNLPKFDDLTRYDVGEDEEVELWKLEVHRLVTAVKSPQPPSVEGAPEWYGNADHDGYNGLHRVARAMTFSLDICIHDNGLLMLEHQPQLSNVSSYNLAHERLLGNFDPDEGTIRYDQNLRLDQHNDEAFHALVNYATATLARLLIRTVKDDSWVDSCLIAVAKIAAKMKVVEDNLPQAVSRTFEAQREFQVRMRQLARGQDDTAKFKLSGKKLADVYNNPEIYDPLAKRQTALKTDLDTSAARYFLLVVGFGHNISTLLSSAISNLSWHESYVQSSDVFETSTIVYDTGFRGLKTQLSQERDGSIGAAADQNAIRCAGMAFDVCTEIWAGLPSTEEPQEPYSSIHWNRTELASSGDLGQSIPGSRDLTAMKDVITALVPYLMFCGRFPSSLSVMARGIFLLSDSTDPVRYYAQPNFLAAVRIRTSQYEKSHKTALNNASVLNVFDTSMAQEGALAGLSADISEEAAQALRQRHQSTNDKFRDATAQLGKWVIDERSIVIHSVWFSWVVLMVVGTLVGGGVALVAIQTRIAGVDPSNLVVLIWTAAGFLVVYFKSMRVENWPWRDFLHGRVVCRSVSEVQAVTKIDPQVLLAVLLRYETRVLLNMRGPFHGLFFRRSNDGFSIDVPARTETAITGGHIFIKVDSINGPALVGISAKNWELYTYIKPKDIKEGGAGRICRDFLDPNNYRLPVEKGEKAKNHSGEGDLSEPLPIYPLCSNELEWYRVQGVFVEKAVFS